MSKGGYYRKSYKEIMAKVKQEDSWLEAILMGGVTIASYLVWVQSWPC